MGRSFGKISNVTASLPCRNDLGPKWCIFNLLCSKGEEEEFLAQLGQALGEFLHGDSRVIFISRGEDTDTVETTIGEEEVSIFTCFLTVEPLSLDKIQALNAGLVDLFGTEPADLLTATQELAEL